MMWPLGRGSPPAEEWSYLICQLFVFHTHIETRGMHKYKVASVIMVLKRWILVCLTEDMMLNTMVLCSRRILTYFGCCFFPIEMVSFNSCMNTNGVRGIRVFWPWPGRSGSGSCLDPCPPRVRSAQRHGRSATPPGTSYSPSGCNRPGRC